MATDERQALEYYNYVRNRGSLALRKLAAFSDRRGARVSRAGVMVSRASLLTELADELERKVFTIAVVGEFSRGKSTLLNALLGRPGLLPTAVMPTTSTITVLHYGEDERADVRFTDGFVQERVPLNELARFVVGQDLDGTVATSQAAKQVRLESAQDAEQVNLQQLGQAVGAGLNPPGAHGPVAEVNVYCRAPFLRNNLRLVDTPGMGSLNPEHGERTREYIHLADAVIFLINTDPVISASECNFLVFLQDYVSNFIFGITKIDRCSERELRESLTYTTQMIRQYTKIDQPAVVPISARQYLDALEAADDLRLQTSRFPEFLTTLHEHLISERGKLVLQNAVRLVKPHQEDLKRAVLLELQSLDLSQNDLTQRLSDTFRVLRDAREAQGMLFEMTEKEVARVDELLETGVDWSRMVSGLLRDEMRTQIDQYDWHELKQAGELLPNFVRERIQAYLQGPLQRVTNRIVEYRKEVTDWCVELLNGMDQQIPFDLESRNDTMEWDFVFEFDADRFIRQLRKVGTVTIGSTLAFALSSALLFQGVGVAIVVSGVVTGGAVAHALRERTRHEIKRAAEETLLAVGPQLRHFLRYEALHHLHQIRDYAVHTLDSAISNVDEAARQMQVVSEGSVADVSARRVDLRNQLKELESIGQALFEMRFWAGYVAGQNPTDE